MYWIIQLPPVLQESRGLKFGHNKGSFEICLTHFKNYCKHNKPCTDIKSINLHSLALKKIVGII